MSGPPGLNLCARLSCGSTGRQRAGQSARIIHSGPPAQAVLCDGGLMGVLKGTAIKWGPVSLNPAPQSTPSDPEPTTAPGGTVPKENSSGI